MNPEGLTPEDRLTALEQGQQRIQEALDTLNRRLSSGDSLPPHFHKVDRVSQRDVQGGFDQNTTAPTYIEEEGRIAFQIADTSTTTVLRYLYAKLDRNWYGIPLYASATPPMGSAFQYNSGTVVAIASANTDTQVTGFTSGTLSGMSFASNQFTIALAGKYLAIWSASFSSGTANQNFEFGYMVNTTLQTKTVAHTKVTTASDKKSCSGQGILTLAVGDTVKLVVRNEDSAADPTIDHAQMTLIKI